MTAINSKMLTDQNGGLIPQYYDATNNVWVAITTAAPMPVSVVAATTSAPSNATSAAYEASHIIKASGGVLFGLSGYNSKLSAQFILLHDSATLPADTAVPAVIIPVAASSSFSYAAGSLGRKFANGIVICNSSTGPTKTIGSSDCWFDAQYL